MKTRPLGIPNMRVGSLVAIELVPDGKKRKIWRCRCDCGNEVFHPAYALRGGRIRSCGCSRRYPLVDKIGGLQVLREVAPRPAGRKWKRGERLWVCRCHCGREFKRTPRNLQRSNTDCGCELTSRKATARRAAALARQATVEFKARAKYNGYKHRAKNRGFKFSITLDSFTKLISSPCAYCGGSGTGDVGLMTKYGTMTDSWSSTINGIDRIDNSLGYVEGNCASCCTTCNLMKRMMSVAEFAVHIEKIHKHMKKRK